MAFKLTEAGRAKAISDGWTPEKIAAYEKARSDGWTDEQIQAEMNRRKKPAAPKEPELTPEQRYMAERRAEAEARQVGSRNMFVRGAVGLSDAPARVGEAGVQLGLAGAEMAGLVDEGSVAEQARKASWRRYAKTGNDPFAEQMATAGEFALYFTPVTGALRSAGVLKGLSNPRTIARAFGRGAKTGATAGFLAQGMTEGDAVQAADVFMNRTVGAAWGAGLGLAAATPQAIITGGKNLLVRAVRNTQQNQETLRLLANRMEEIGDLSMAQKTGSPLYKRLEVQAGAVKAQEFYNRQLLRFNTALANWSAGLHAASRGDTTALGLTRELNRHYLGQREATFAAANKAYEARLTRAIANAADDIEAPIAMQSTDEVVRKWEAETGGTWWRKLHPGAEKMAPELSALKRQDAAMLPSMSTGPSGQMALTPHSSFADLVKLRRSLNNMDRDYWKAKSTLSGPTPEQLDAHRAVAEMRRAVDADIDAFLAANQGADRGAVKALEELREANKDYGALRDYVKEMDETAVAQFFGQGVPREPEKALETMLAMEPAQQRILVDLMRTADPTLLNRTKAFVVQRAWEKGMAAGRTRPGAAVPIDMDAWANAIRSETGQVLGAELFTKAELAKVSRALDTIRLLKNSPVDPSGVFVTGIERTVDIQGTGMAAVSRSEAFMTRAAIRFGGMGKIEELLFTSRGQKALETLRDTSTWKTTTGQKALATIMSMITRQDQETQAGRLK